MNHRFAYLTLVFGFLCVCLAPNSAAADPNNYGVTGLVNMPDARVAEDGTATGGMGFSRPYVPVFATMTVLPGLEMNFRYTRFMSIPGFAGNTGFGDYKDKAIDLKAVLVQEGGLLPQIAIGVMDIHGTRLLPAHYVVASKSFGELDLTLGFGGDRLDGLFGGARYRPDWASGFGLALEYDGFDYAGDFGAAGTGATLREGGLTAALEYTYGVLGARVSHEDGELGARLYMSIPWGRSEFYPKSDEPKPLYEAAVPAEPIADWRADTPALRDLVLELERQHYTSIRIAALPDGVLEARLENRRITHMGRAVGRAARTLLLMGPQDMQGLRITYWSAEMPIATYEFTDLGKLRGYFAGTVAPADFAPTVSVAFTKPEDSAAFAAHALELDEGSLPDPEFRLGAREYKAGAPLRFMREARNATGINVRPINISTVFNDPSGALKYDLYSTLGASWRLGKGLYGYGTLRLTLKENTSDTNNVPSNSLLPHVRTDLGFYLDEGPFKLDGLVLVKYLQLDERVYARVSGGLYEMMFAGVGGEVLWLPRSGPWAFTTTVEALRQRDFQGYFGFQDYSTVQVLGAAHYRIPRYGVTLTARAGRFLAKDEGVRFEFKRQLRSGFQFGVWYSVTNGNDITSPGSPSSPYHDKGAFIAMPFHAFLKKDTRGHFAYAMGAWNRDVGQIAQGPGLYNLFEHSLMLNHEYYNPLSLFGQ